MESQRQWPLAFGLPAMHNGQNASRTAPYVLEKGAFCAYLHQRRLCLSTICFIRVHSFKLFILRGFSFVKNGLRGPCCVSNKFPYAPLLIKERTSPKLSLADALAFYVLYSTQEKRICQILFGSLAPPASKILCAISTQKGQIGFPSCQIFRTHENRRQKNRSLLTPDSLQQGFSGAELQNLRHPAR